MHEDDPTAADEKSGQIVQLGEPAFAEYESPSHIVQLESPAEEYVPLGQIVQTRGSEEPD